MSASASQGWADDVEEVARPSRFNAARRLANRQQQIEEQERREALRAMLIRPLLSADGETLEDFRLVRRHAQWLRDWFARWPGWTLVIGGDVARLRKHPSLRRDATRGLEEKSGADRTLTSRRGYALLCLVLALLETEHRQTTLQQVARKTELSVRMDAELVSAGFEFDPRTLAHRRELVQAMRQLERLGVLARIDRDDRDFVSGDGDCLYRIDRAVLSSLLCSLHGPSILAAQDPAELIEKLNYVEPPQSPDAFHRHLQHRLVRRLLDDPVMYYDELSPDEYEYFNSQGERLIAEVAKVTGLIPERRAEGVAMLDVDGSLTDVALPELGTRGHATLLLAEWLAGRLAAHERSAPPADETTAPRAGRVPIEELEEQTARLAALHARHWYKGSNTPEGIRRIARDAVSMLRTLGLCEVLPDVLIPRPAISRFRVLSEMEAEA